MKEACLTLAFCAAQSALIWLGAGFFAKTVKYLFARLKCCPKTERVVKEILAIAMIFLLGVPLAFGGIVVVTELIRLSPQIVAAAALAVVSFVIGVWYGDR